MDRDTLIIVLASLGILVLLLRIWRKKKGKFKLDKDSSGFWRYYPETQFKLKRAYSGQVGDAKPDKKAKSVAVVDFDGDLKAKQHKVLSRLVDEILLNKDELEEVVVRVSSPGGLVPHYGHAYAQLERIRSKELPLTVCVDVVAASGGYLMSLPANKILAAPMAMVGSVGVMAFVPNVRKLLLDLKVNPRTFTAGKFKRTVTLTDDATPEEVGHFQEQLESVHQQFVGALTKYRPEVDVDKVATGDHWTASESVEKQLGLVDEISTSNEYLLERNRNANLVFLSQKKSFLEDGFSLFGSKMLDAVEDRAAFWASNKF